MPQDFLFATCQHGAEAALKQEVARDYPALRFAFSRPGFLTFKWTGEPGALQLDCDFRAVFARAWGISLGKVTGDPESMSRAVAETAKAQIPGPGKIRLHVWERDRYAPENAPADFVANTWAQAARAAILQENSAHFSSDPEATAGETVFDVIVVEPQEWWLGMHRQTPGRLAFPGGKPEIALPAGAPSRAYLKLEEGILWSGAPLATGDLALEIGSAPGGASFALLERGLRVIGIDPARMDARILAHPNFQHIALPVNRVLRKDLPEDIRWILLDMNVEPRVSLSAVGQIAAWTQGSLRGLLLTVKLNDWKFAAEIPDMLKAVGAMGMKNVRATQLASNRQEIFVYAEK